MELKSHHKRKLLAVRGLSQRRLIRGLILTVGAVASSMSTRKSTARFLFLMLWFFLISYVCFSAQSVRSVPCFQETAVWIQQNIQMTAKFPYCGSLVMFTMGFFLNVQDASSELISPFPPSFGLGWKRPVGSSGPTTNPSPLTEL